MSGDTPQATLIVGLEIHVQLKTATKLFCGCPVRYAAEPNTCTCPVCLGLPGALPVMNREAINHAIRTGLALNCEIAPFTKWDRKSYYYPDLPKNYQISQYDIPIAANGFLDIEVDGSDRRIGVIRAHLEEDAGKNIHDTPGCTLVDLNRTGTPLLEIVTCPDLRSAEEAYTFCTELQRLILHLGVSDGNMQLGQMRFEPNVNVAIKENGEVHHTPIAEIKNLNSFRAVRLAIEYEYERQLAAWRENHDYLKGKSPNENRGWDDDRGMTVFQRAKESADDYRYFPDPDLVPVTIAAERISEHRSALPEMPVARRRRFIETFGLSRLEADTIVSHRETADLFDQVLEQGAPPDVTGKQFTNVWLKLANDRNVPVTKLSVDATRMAALAKMTADGVINKSAANEIAKVMLDKPESPDQLATDLGLLQVRDSAQTQAWVDQAISENQQAVKDAASNPKKTKAAAGFLRGQVMRISGGKADPKLVGELIEKKLAEYAG